MKRICIILALALTACTAKAPLSLRVVRSEMARCPEATFIDGLDGRLKWNYTTGLELKAFLDATPAEDVLDYVDAWYDSVIDSTGRIYKYRKENFSLDHVCPGRTLYQLNDSGNGNGIFFARTQPSTAYVVSYNMIAAVTNSVAAKVDASLVKPAFSHNFYYSINDKFYTGGLTKEETLTGNGVILSEDPFKDAASGDFTLVNALAQSCGVGAPKWNPAADTVPASSFKVENAEQFASAIEAGKTDILFAAGEYTLNTVSLTANMHLRGEKGAILNILQFDIPASTEPMGSLVIENLSIRSRATNDAGDAVSNNLINVATAFSADRLIVRNCSVDGVKKSLIYGNGEDAKFGAVVFSNLLVTNQGTGQGVFDFRKGEYGTITVEDCTVKGGRDCFRVDASVKNDVLNVTNNLFDAPAPNGNGVFYLRSTQNSVYRITNNLFINMTEGTNIFGKKDTNSKTPTQVSNNHFFKLKDGFWGGIIDEAAGTAGGGSILAADPCADAANGDYTLTDEALKKADVGPARWNPMSGQLRVKRGRR